MIAKVSCRNCKLLITFLQDPMKYLLLTCVLVPLFTVAQEKIIKFGNVTLSELKMTHYERDSSCLAVILYDGGYFNANDFQFTRHVRIKILSTAGTSFGNFTIQTPAKSFIDGFTFNVENGLLKKTKLENSNIYEEEIVNGFEVYKLFFPDVKPGSVIDLKYAHPGMPFEWRFQDRIPVVYNELTLEPTTYIYFKKVFYGFEKIKEIKDNHWVGEHIPAIAREPYMAAYSNYVTRFQFDIENISLPRWSFYREYSTSWEKVGQRLMEMEYFGGVISGCAFLNSKAKELEESTMPIPDKVNSAFQYIQDNVKWNKVSALIASRAYRESFNKNHSGNSAEVNLFFITLLRKAGIEVYPVVLSTRENGLINPISASFNKLNYVIGLVQYDSQTLLVDVTSPHGRPGILPEHCLNMSGWVIDKKGGYMIDLSPLKRNVVKQFIRIAPDQNNQFIAEVTNTYEDYGYLNWVTVFEEYGSEGSYLNYLRSQRKTEAITNYKLGTVDKNKLRVSETSSINLSETTNLQDIGAELIVNPFLFTDIENPFRMNERKFPIDFIYPRHRSVIVSMTLPVGYTFKSIPQSSKVEYPGGKGKFSLLCNADKNMLNIRCDFTISSTLFLEEEYEIVKAFFNEVLKKINEPVQIIKT